MITSILTWKLTKWPHKPTEKFGDWLSFKGCLGMIWSSKCNFYILMAFCYEKDLLNFIWLLNSRFRKEKSDFREIIVRLNFVEKINRDYSNALSQYWLKFVRKYTGKELDDLGPLHVLWQVSFGCWVSWSISSWQKYCKSVFFPKMSDW